MSRLILIRHGQASFHAEDYDQLSELGQRQSRVLGDHWAAAGLAVDGVYVGSLRRHRQTAEQVADAYDELRLPWPEESGVLDELRENDSMELMRRVMPDLRQRDPEIRRLVTEARGRSPADRSDVFLKLYRRFSRLWSRGEIEDDGDVESWPAFRSRVEAGLAKIYDAEPGGRTVLAFTSGGPIAAAVGQVLGLGDEKAMELSWIVQNSSLTEILFSQGRLSLKSFNALPHFDDGSELATFI